MQNIGENLCERAGQPQFFLNISIIEVLSVTAVLSGTIKKILIVAILLLRIKIRVD